jgi:hypothetical protein
MDGEFFANFGTKSRNPIWRRYWKVARWVDTAVDLRIAAALRRVRKAAQNIPPQRVLLTAVQVPGREADLARVIAAMSRSKRHRVTTAVAPMAPVGKFDNIARAIAGHDLSQFDWLLVTDDDVDIPEDFLDLLVYFGHAHALKLLMPAHKFCSHSSARLIERRWGCLARQTRFVENGPVTLFHRDTFAALIPFPSLRWAWGIDVFWSHVAMQHGWKMGVIDAAALKHLRPVGNSYDRNEARREAEEFLRKSGVTLRRREIVSLNQRIA